MYLYNVTVNIDDSAHAEWKNWMLETHIPEVLATGIFHHHVFYRLVHHSEDGSVNYCIQYFTDSMDRMLQYERMHAPALRAKTQERYQDQAIAFRTLLETI